ncbi:MAG: neutral/alkaline non-lysosomal ceramidase N-terminal domain-containing protein [Planctomycetes bacterium]|nr:neutral/alkaline non-lysosomal ceramidase N-terminal domain-containing protein [Planctomycetota bacterium]
MRRTWVAAMLGLASLAGAAEPSPSAPAKLLRAGFAVVDITPAQPVTLAGYASRKELSRGVHDPLSARAVAFERDGERLVLVSTDIIGFYGDTLEIIRRAILDATGLERSQLFLSAIHTHSAPRLTFHEVTGHPNNVAYTKDLQEKLTGLVRRAMRDAVPIRFAAGSGASPVGVNRREVVKDDAGNSKIVLGRNPSVLTDREVQVLRIARADSGKLAAVLFSYPTHSTSMGPGNYLVGGDVHGLAEQFIERHLGGGVIAPAFAGASGDIDPWFRVLPEFKTEGGWIPEAVLLGTLLGEEVVSVERGIEEAHEDGRIATVSRTLALPATEAGSGQSGPPNVPLEVTLGRLGRVAFVGLGCEVFNEIGRAIKSSSPFPATFVITHCNGAAGYLPTESSYPEGGYEVRSTSFAPSAAGIVVEEVGRMLRDLWSE